MFCGGRHVLLLHQRRRYQEPTAEDPVEQLQLHFSSGRFNDLQYIEGQFRGPWKVKFWEMCKPRRIVRSEPGALTHSANQERGACGIDIR